MAPRRTRERIRDTTRDLIEAGGFAAVSVAAVAAAAEVSRQTVYTHFGTLEQLVHDVMLGEAEQLLAEVTAELAGCTTPLDYIAELTIACRRAIRTHPVLVRLIAADAANPLNEPLAMNRAVPVAEQILAPVVAMAPELAVDRTSLAELVVRLGLSVIRDPGGSLGEDDAVRSFYARWLGPALRWS